MGLTKVTYSMIEGATFNVFDYGATGDGSTNDTVALQAALDAVPSTGGAVYIPSGTYIITQSIVIKSNTLLFGDGNASQIKASQSAFVGTLAGNSVYLVRNQNWTASVITDENITIENLSFNYGTVVIVGGGAHCISMRYVENVNVINCDFYNGENATAFLATNNTLVDGCSAYDFINCAYDHWTSPSNAIVTNCYARTANTVGFVNFNPETTALASGTADGFVLSNCVFEATGSSVAAIQLEPLLDGSTAKNITVANNVFKRIILVCRRNTQNAVIEGNLFTDFPTSYTQFIFAASIVPPQVDAPSNITFNNNIIIDPRSGVGTAVVALLCNNYMANGNIITGSNYFLGFTVNSGTTSYVGKIANNVFNTGTSGYLINGTTYTNPWNTVTYQNSWVSFGGSTYPAQYYRDEYNVVHLRGAIKDGTLATAAFTLPVDLRPTSEMIFSVNSNNAFGCVTVSSSGTVTPNVGNNLSVYLDGISFRAD